MKDDSLENRLRKSDLLRSELVLLLGEILEEIDLLTLQVFTIYDRLREIEKRVALKIKESKK